MKNLLVTLNLGGTYTPDNVRSSMLHAANRWGAQYLEVVSSNLQNQFAIKLRIWDHIPSGADRVLFMDSDMLIRQDCPSPFALVPPTHLGVVQNFQDDFVWPDQEPEWKILCHWFGAAGLEYKRDEFFNTGLVLSTPSIHVHTWNWIADRVLQMVKDRAAAQKESAGLWGSEEQTSMNIGFQMSGVPIAYLSHDFNRNGAAVFNGPKMGSFIEHYAGEGMNGRTKRQQMESVAWRT